jgi:large subunit ribosomal protein L29
MTKIAELRSKTTDQLHEQLLSLKKEQFNLRFQKATGQLEKTHRVNEIRKDVARIQSLLTAQKAAAKSA